MKSYFFLILLLNTLYLFGQNKPTPIQDKSKQMQKTINVEISVEGMSCQKGCADGIDKALKKTDGVIKSRTLLESGICKVTYDDSIIKIEKIIKIIEDRGFKTKVLTQKR